MRINDPLRMELMDECLKGITLNEGPAGRADWKDALPNENMNFPRAGKLHRRAGRQAAPQDGQVGCTLRRSAH